MRPKGTPSELEARRRRALHFLGEGLSLSEVGRRLGCAPSSVMRWRNMLVTGGSDALVPRTSPGRPRKLLATQEERLRQELLLGACASGFRSDLWTSSRVAAVVQKLFGVRYHRSHIPCVMTRLGWGYRKNHERSDQPRLAGWRPTAPSAS